MFEYVVCRIEETIAWYGTDKVRKCTKILQVFKTREEAEAADAIFMQHDDTCILHVSEIHKEF